MAMYAGYLTYMVGSMRRSQAARAGEEIDEEEDDDDDDQTGEPGPIGKLFYWMSLGPVLDLEGLMVKEKHREQIKAETWNGWPLLGVSAAVIGAACWLLVKACEWLGTGNGAHPSYTLFGNEYVGLGMPTMFVAVIFAAMATSVPDTIISIRDARDGDYDDAVANAVGSNIFDICFALGFPLFLYTILNGPIEMTPETMDESGELRAMLLVLTLVGSAFYLIGRRGTDARGAVTIALGKFNAWMLLALYGFFLAYILGRSAGMGWAATIAGWIKSAMSLLPGA
jgi:cation:H+ antiporter